MAAAGVGVPSSPLLFRPFPLVFGVADIRLGDETKMG